MPLVQTYILDAAQRSPGTIALHSPERSLTYHEMSTSYNRIAEHLIVEGLHKNDRVLILLRDNIDVVLATYGAIRAGGIAVPVPESSEFSTIELIAKQCKPFCILTTRNDLTHYPLLRDKLSCRFSFLEQINPSNTSLRQNIDDLKPAGDMDSVDRISALMNISEGDGAFLHYEPVNAAHTKGVLFTHQNLIQETANLQEVDPLPATTRELVLHGVAHIYGFTRIQHILSSGGTAIIPRFPRYRTELFQELLTQPCDSISIAAELFSPMVDQVTAVPPHVGQSIQRLEICTSKISSTDKNVLLELFPNAKITLWYSTIEAPRITRLELRSEHTKHDSVGRNSPNVEIAVRNGSKRSVRRGLMGEVFVRGNHIMNRYWGDDELTASMVSDDHWLRTGKFGYLDREGYLYFPGEKEELINAAGLLISPIEVEARIHEAYPGYEVCVIGIPDPDSPTNDLPVLCYRAHEGKTIIPSEFSKTLSNRMDKVKIPKIVIRVDSFPKADDKILRKELREIILGGVSQAIHEMDR